MEQLRWTAIELQSTLLLVTESVLHNTTSNQTTIEYKQVEHCPSHLLLLCMTFAVLN